jgi:RNA polymerase sigma-70 factor (ECF subfamily)
MHRRRSGRGIRAAARFAREWPLEDDAVSRIDERLDAEAKHRELFGALDRLPGGQRAVMELVAIDGLSVTEAATALGITPLLARVRLHRARVRMAEGLAEAVPVDIERFVQQPSETLS